MPLSLWALVPEHTARFSLQFCFCLSFPVEAVKLYLSPDRLSCCSVLASSFKLESTGLLWALKIKKYIVIFPDWTFHFVINRHRVTPPTNTLYLFHGTLPASSQVSPTFPSLADPMSLETFPLSSILDHAVVYCLPVRTHHECRPYTRAASPAVCSGCTTRSEECCCCRTLFRRASELPLSHLA